MNYGIVYKVIIREVLSTVIYLAFVDKDCWNGRKTGTGLLIGSRRVESNG